MLDWTGSGADLAKGQEAWGEGYRVWRNGTDMPLGAVVRSDEPLHRGMMFEYAGELWEVAWRGNSAWGARPVEAGHDGGVE